MYIGKEDEGLINLDRCTRIFRLSDGVTHRIVFENEVTGYIWSYKTKSERDADMARIVRYICDSGRMYV